MPKVTALCEEREDRVRVELDGSAWRTLPASAVLAAELRVGVELDRTRARSVRRALRRTGALDTAARALSRQDRSAAATEALLERSGFTFSERAETIASLGRLGYLDDSRYAAGRAQRLASRGYGDGAIRFDLERHGVGDAAAAAALGAVEPEHERARRLARGLAASKAWRRLASKGFSIEAIEGAVGPLDT